MNSIEQRLQALRSQIGDRANLIAVSKTRSAQEVLAAYECGQRHFGENKAQELLDKALQLKESCPDIKWHFIGALQSNKINMLLKVPNLVSIHSIDSIKLLNKLLSKEADKRVGVFLQLNLAREASKSGFVDLEELKRAVDILFLPTDQTQSHGFFLQGLMAIGPLEAQDFKTAASQCFSQLSELAKEIECDKGVKLELSMGMSQDFEEALNAGSNWLRIGTQIFGKRS